MEYTSEQLLELFQNMLHRLQLVPEAPGRSSNKSGISFTVMTIPFWKWEDIPQNGHDFYNDGTTKRLKKNARYLTTI